MVHEDRVLADSVEVASSFPAKVRGMMFREQPPAGFALVFPFGSVKHRSVHMLGVRYPLDVVWVVGERVERVGRLRPWVGVGWARADTIIELPAGAAGAVTPGDVVRVSGEE